MNLPSLLRNQALPCAIALSLLAAGSASAADGTWTGGTSTSWATTANWLNGTVPGANDTAIFNSASYSNLPAATANLNLGTLLFDSGNTGALTITTTNGANRLNLSGGIQMNAGSGAATVGAASTQGISLLNNVSFANNSSSLLTVRLLSVDESVPSGTATVTMNGSGSGGMTFGNGGMIDGTAAKLALNVNTTGGATVLGSASTYSGGTTLTQGLLQIARDSVGSVGAITSSAIGTGTLALNGGTLSSGSGGARTLLNAVTVGGNVTLGNATNDGTLTFSAGVDLGGSARTLTTASAVTLGGIVSNGGITKQGASVLTLSGSSANTYTGLTTVSAGGLTLSKTAVVAVAGNVLVDGTGTLTLGASDQIINTSSVEVAAGTLALATFNETVNNLKLTGGAITGSGTLTSTTAFDFQSSGNIAAVLAGAAGANKTTAGTVTFSGANANTYTGLTTVSAGSLVLSKTAGVVALAGDALVNGGTLQIGSANQIMDTANLEVATGGTFALGGNADTVNGVKLTGGAITGTSGNGILTSITAYDLQSGSSSAVLAGTAGATKTTAGTVTLTRASTYSGGTTLSDGTLQLGNDTALGIGSLALNGGKISSSSAGAQLPANNTTIGGNVTLGDAVNTGRLTFSGTMDLGGATRTLTTDSSVEFTGIVSNGGIIKQGASTLRLSGENTYAGGTTISSGILQIGLGGTSGSVVGDIAVDGELIFNKTDSAVLSNTLTGTGVLTKNGAGTLILTTAASAFSGTTTTSGGVLALSNANALSNSVLQLNVDGSRIAFVLPDATDYRLGGLRGTAPTLVMGSNSLTLGKDAGTNGSFGGVISGTGGLTKVGSSTQTLAGANTYSGTTTVGGGLLVVNGSIASSAATVNSGGTLAGSGSVGGLIVTTGGTISPGNSPGNFTVAGNMLWNGGGNYNWQVLGTTNTSGAAAGTTWDLITVTGALDLTALTTSSKFNINLWSLSSALPDTNGNIADFNPTTSYEWLAVSASNITGFNAAHFAVNVGAANGTGGFSNPLDGSYVFGVRQDGGNLYVTYGSAAPIPEPGTWAAMAIFAGGAAYAGWRRRKSAKVSE